MGARLPASQGRGLVERGVLVWESREGACDWLVARRVGRDCGRVVEVVVRRRGKRFVGEVGGKRGDGRLIVGQVRAPAPTRSMRGRCHLWSRSAANLRRWRRGASHGNTHDTVWDGPGWDGRGPSFLYCIASIPREFRLWCDPGVRAKVPGRRPVSLCKPCSVSVRS
jgi:hypothetical protein